MKFSIPCGLALLFACVQLHAATVLFDGSGTNAIGIDGLEIGGIFYDIDFEFVNGSETPITALDPAIDIFANDPDGESKATGATNAIIAALKEGGAQTAGTSGGSVSNFLVPFGISCGIVQGQQECVTESRRGFKSSPASSNWSNLSAETFEDVQIDFARFTPSTVVPVPPAVYLFGSGLAMLGWMRRRKST